MLEAWQQNFISNIFVHHPCSSWIDRCLRTIEKFQTTLNNTNVTYRQRQYSKYQHNRNECFVVDNHYLFKYFINVMYLFFLLHGFYQRSFIGNEYWSVDKTKHRLLLSETHSCRHFGGSAVKFPWFPLRSIKYFGNAIAYVYFLFKICLKGVVYPYVIYLHGMQLAWKIAQVICNIFLKMCNNIYVI